MSEVAKTKVCGKCKRELPLDANHFFRSKKKCGFKSICKDCSKSYIREYRRANSDAIKLKKKEYSDKHSEELKDKRRKNYQNNREKSNKYSRSYYKKNKVECRIKYRSKRAQWYLSHRESKLAYACSYKIINRDRLNRYCKDRRRKDPNYRMRCNLRSRIRIAVREQQTAKSSHSISLIGCSWGQLKQHLEQLFLPGMTWENYGKGGWEIDHIIPCIMFDLTKSKEQEKCFHFTNLRPLWKSDNASRNKTRKKQLTEVNECGRVTENQG